MADYYAYQGDTLATITDTLGVDVSAYSTVAFVAKLQGGSNSINRAGTIDGSGTGQVTVQLTAADLARSGFWNCAWQFDDGGGGVWTVPADTPKVLSVRESLT